jgi:alanine racemase
MIRQTVAHVDLDAVRSNYRAIAGFLGSPAGLTDPRPAGPAIIAVVKANAYGHGAAPVGLALEAEGAAMLACADIEEGIALRQAGHHVVEWLELLRFVGGLPAREREQVMARLRLRFGARTW